MTLLNNCILMKEKISQKKDLTLRDFYDIIDISLEFHSLTQFSQFNFSNTYGLINELVKISFSKGVASIENCPICRLYFDIYDGFIINNNKNQKFGLKEDLIFKLLKTSIKIEKQKLSLEDPEQIVVYTDKAEIESIKDLYDKFIQSTPYCIENINLVFRIIEKAYYK